MSNPFDDPFDGDTANSPLGVTNNPFDSERTAVAANNNNDGKNNPFDDYFTDNTNAANANPDPAATANNNTAIITSTGGSPVSVTAATTSQPPMTAEASWQYLGDLPYRRVPIYSNVRWNNSAYEQQQQQQQQQQQYLLQQQYNQGLAAFPQSVLLHYNHTPSGILDPREIRTLLSTTTTTKVTGCPHGGPIAAITLPIVAGEAMMASGAFSQAELRIMTNAGKPIVTIPFPPPRGGGLLEKRRYSPSDILTIGFTDRTTLMVILRDSLCLTYNLKGEYILPPFHILPTTTTAAASGDSDKQGGKKGMELLQATVYDGGAAVLSTSKHSAIVELLDDHDDPTYFSAAHIGARRIFPKSTHSTGATTHEPFASGQDATPPNYAIVTHLPTAEHAKNYFVSYLAIAVLPRHRTSSRHPEVFISTNDNSVIMIDVATCQITDAQCRARISSPIVEMSFAPNGRFLACFTQSMMLTVISTSFETKVLDFDTSEGSSSPPLDMKWCGEDSVVLHWKNLGVLMVGPYGDWLRFPYEGSENVYLVPEMDCCRVITDTSVEILQRVPPATALLLRLGSIEPSAMLLDASDAFECGSPASEEAARAIIRTGALQEAIETCTEAATKEFDIVTQKRLLRAASYGLHFSYKDSNEQNNIMGGRVALEDITNGNNGNSDPYAMALERPSTTTIKFVAASKKLRVMNALRNPNVGFVLTSSQYDAITPIGVTARLIAMKRPALATEISKYLHLPKSVQLYARASKASALIEAEGKRMSNNSSGSGGSTSTSSNTNRTDAEIAEAAIRLINNERGDKNLSALVAGGSAATSTSALIKSSSLSSSMNRGAYATVAVVANKAGLPGVANLLLMLESSVADKVPALISTGSFPDAMAVATAARDADFIFATLMEYERACMASATSSSSSSDAATTKANATFIQTVVSKFTSEGFNTLRRYMGTMSDIKSVITLLLRAQKFTDAGTTMAIRAIASTGQSSRNNNNKNSPNNVDARDRQNMLLEASRVFGLGKETAFHKTCTDDYLELLKDQEVLRTKYGAYEVAPDSSSVTSTMTSVIQYAAVNKREQHRLLADADKIARKFRIPEKRLWHIKVKAFADSGQWDNLRTLADSKSKPPIGFKPFALAAIRGKQKVNEILRYIERVAIPEEKYDLYCEAGLWKLALDEAARRKDARRVMNVKNLCNDSDVQLLADQVLARIA